MTKRYAVNISVAVSRKFKQWESSTVWVKNKNTYSNIKELKVYSDAANTTRGVDGKKTRFTRIASVIFE